MPVPFFKPNSDEELNLDLSGDNGLLVITTDNGNYHIDKSHILFRTPSTANLGNGTYPFNDVYTDAVQITSSDERRKSCIDPFPDAVLDAWEDVQWCQFKYTSAVAAKGDAARLHAGLIAQRILEVFNAHGLDACDYGLICHSEWSAEPEKLDEEGNVLEPACPAGDLWMLRYSECLAVEAAYQRRRIDQLEERVNQLTSNSNK